MPSNQAKSNYRERNREELRQKNKAYRAALQPEKKQEKQRRDGAARVARYRSDPAFAARSREQNRGAQLKHKYGLTVAQRQDIFDKQGGRCAIKTCTRPCVFGGQGGAVVDHDHTTGRVRGVLCAACNKALGLLGDSVVGLQAALHYLEASDAV